MRSLPNKVEEYVFLRFNVLQKDYIGFSISSWPNTEIRVKWDIRPGTILNVGAVVL